jgi:hypothetical protein
MSILSRPSQEGCAFTRSENTAGLREQEDPLFGRGEETRYMVHISYPRGISMESGEYSIDARRGSLGQACLLCPP